MHVVGNTGDSQIAGSSQSFNLRVQQHVRYELCSFAILGKFWRVARNGKKVTEGLYGVTDQAIYRQSNTQPFVATLKTT